MPLPAAHRDAPISERGSLLIGIALNLCFAALEAAAGLVANSLVLLSDSVHDLSDAAALGLTYLGLRLAEQRPDSRRTFGYRKVRILAAFVNALALIVLTVFLVRAAILRLIHPEPVAGPVLLLVAALGIVVNGIAVLFLRQHKRSLSIRAALWHLVEDLMGSAAVLIGGIIMSYTHWFALDAILSLVLAIVVVYGAFTVFRDASRILIDSTPTDLDYSAVAGFIRDFDPAISGVHDLHIWTLGESERALMCHLVVLDDRVSCYHPLLARMEEALRREFQITHVTLELECEACKSGENVCTHPSVTQAD